MSVVLGKGLGSLLGDNLTIEPLDSQRIISLSPELIQANRQQPRQNFDQDSLQDLANSISKHGILQPLVVTKTTTGYELIAGERRLRAAKLLKLKTVPVIVRSVDEQQKLALALIENVQRENLNPLEEAMAYRRLLDEFKLTQDQLANQLGKSRSTIANLLRLLSLPEVTQEALQSGQINLGQAKVLAGLSSDKQKQALEKMTKQPATVAETTKIVRSLSPQQPPIKAIVQDGRNDKGKEFLLKEFFQLPVRIVRQSPKSGQIVISFNDDSQLAVLMEKIRR